MKIEIHLEQIRNIAGDSNSEYGLFIISYKQEGVKNLKSVIAALKISDARELITGKARGSKIYLTKDDDGSLFLETTSLNTPNGNKKTMEINSKKLDSYTEISFNKNT